MMLSMSAGVRGVDTSQGDGGVKTYAVADQFVMVKFSFEPMRFECKEVPVIMIIHHR